MWIKMELNLIKNNLPSKKAKLIETESRMPGTGSWENGEILVKRYKLPVIRWVSLGDLMYSMVMIVNNTVLYIQKLLKE